jgi:hypothetical protein
MNKHFILSKILVLLTASIATAQQLPDLKYSPPIPRPAYKVGKGPRVAIDEAHFNFHTSEGRYKPFADFLRRDGYCVDPFIKQFSGDALTTVDILVIANALNERNQDDWSLPTPSAFTRNEISALRLWVQEGGSLLLIADHMPFPGAASELAKEFGVAFSNGYARPGYNLEGPRVDIFEPSTGLIESAITKGRAEDQKVTKVTTFAGSAFKPPQGATPVLVFGRNSVSFETTKAPGIAPDAPKVQIEGWYQGSVFEFGRGRVAVFGEAAMFTAQLAGANQERQMGMNHPEASQNHQLLLNVMHWLTRAEGMPN